MLIVFSDPECKAAADSLQNQCQTDDERFNVAKVCWPILGKPSHQRCFTSHADNPTAIFRVSVYSVQWLAGWLHGVCVLGVCVRGVVVVLGVSLCVG